MKSSFKVCGDSHLKLMKVIVKIIDDYWGQSSIIIERNVEGGD
ncbi:hypothetical protein BD780_000711 [Clostridium tetanomorphum]|nr:hypothetical protein [Clostridium tetanomorphum]MBP1863389.1 hypothetical protein [Clostridium tetanomorphum]NRS83486.1 hypothetical protein [Clostridium tetanomorphum]NRZ96686.1 hypothetical protein [Clostridium tetanomorphum]SQC01856.1 Uncharacterised protein [Clostridium tetanomorphum]